MSDEGGRLWGVARKRTQKPPCVCWRLSRLVRETSGFASSPRGEFALISSVYPIGEQHSAGAVTWQGKRTLVRVERCPSLRRPCESPNCTRRMTNICANRLV